MCTRACKHVHAYPLLPRSADTSCRLPRPDEDTPPSAEADLELIQPLMSCLSSPDVAGAAACGKYLRHRLWSVPTYVTQPELALMKNAAGGDVCVCVCVHERKRQKTRSDSSPTLAFVVSPAHRCACDGVEG